MPRPPAAAREELLNETRTRLLEAAAEEIAQHGFAAANINRISTAAGFAKGTIYNYFNSKRALMLALIEEIAKQHTAFIRGQVKAGSDPRERLESFFRAGFAFVGQYPAQARIAISIVYGHDEEFRNCIFDAYGELFALIGGDIFSAGVSQGEFDPNDPDLITGLLMCLYLGCCSILDPSGEVWFSAKQAADFALEGIQLRNGVAAQKAGGEP